MSQPRSETDWLKIPEGYRPVPLSSADGQGTIRLCLLIRSQPDDLAGHWVLLADWEDTSVYLGCLLDCEDRVYDWVEIFVQNPNNLTGSPSGYRDRLTNALLDRRWTAMVESFKVLFPEDIIATGWEAKNPAPLLVDPASFKVQPATRVDSGQPWILCQNDGRLQNAKLPSYSGSEFRYLYQAVEGGSERFVPVSVQAPENESTEPWSDAVRDGASWVAFNQAAGRLLVRRWSPVDWESYADLLGGKSWPGPLAGKVPFRLGGVYGQFQDAESLGQLEDYLFSPRQGEGACLLETMHLKLQMVFDAMQLVREWVRRQQMPFLNLSADSFRVKLSRSGHGLPSLWTAAVTLAKPSQALALPLAEGDFRYYLPGKIPRPFVYLPEEIHASSEGRGTVRVREVIPPENGRVVVEGTLITQMPLATSPHDLLWLRFSVAGGRVDLYGHLYTEEGLAQGEARFRTLPMTLTDGQQQALKAASGTALSHVSFEVVPLLSTPCDLYALGVLALRTLLVNEESSLGIALDEILSLAREAAQADRKDLNLDQIILELLRKESRWLSVLGPHRLRWKAMEATLAMGMIPLELWSQILAVLVRLFPGAHPKSYAKDYGDAPPAALDAVFKGPLQDLEDVLVRSRSLIVIDWNQNREIHDIIKTLLEKG